MKGELDPQKVARHLATLRTLYVAETVDDARRRLAAERPVDTRTFADKVVQRLNELRALDQLARYLQQAKRAVPGR